MFLRGDSLLRKQNFSINATNTTNFCQTDENFTSKQWESNGRHENLAMIASQSQNCTSLHVDVYQNFWVYLRSRNDPVLKSEFKKIKNVLLARDTRKSRSKSSLWKRERTSDTEISPKRKTFFFHSSFPLGYNFFPRNKIQKPKCSSR